MWCGCDISPSMLEVAHDEMADDSTGDLVRHDMGLGLPFNQVDAIYVLMLYFCPSMRARKLDANV